MAAIVGPVGSSRAGFVGRVADLSWLEGLLQEATAGEPRVALLCGEPGIGKSSLSRQLVASAEARGWQSVWGRCAGGRGQSYGPFLAALVPRLGEARIAPVADTLEAALGFAASDAPDTGALAARLAGKAAELAAVRPLVFVIDDLHVADAGTQALFRDFVAALADSAQGQRLPILVLAAHHPTIPGQGFVGILDRVRREAIARALDLKRMPEPEVNELVWLETGAHCDPPLLEWLTRTTEGNPMFVGEVVRQLLRRNAIAVTELGVTATMHLGDLQAPASVSGAMAERVDVLDTALRTVLQDAALLGEEFTADELLASGADESSLAHLDAGISAGLLEAMPEGFAFAHSLLHLALVASIGPVQRRNAHRRMAAGLREHFGNHPEWAMKTADHAIAGEDGMEDARNGPLFVAAGDMAMRRFAWAAGARYYEVALAVEPFVGRLEAGDHGWLLSKAARGHANSGDAARARARYREAIEAFRASTDYDGWGAAILGWERTFTNASEPLPDTHPYEEFRAAAGNRARDVRARLLAHWAEALWLARHPGDREAAIRAASVAAFSDDAETRSYVHATRGLIELRHLNGELALEAFEASRDASKRLANPRLRGVGTARIPLPLLLLGQLHEAAKQSAAAVALARSGDDWPNGALSHALSHAAANLLGDYDTCARTRIQASMLITRSGYGQASFVLDASVAIARLLRGELHEAADAAASWEHSAGRSVARPFRLLVGAFAGDPDAVRADLAGHELRPSQGLEADFVTLGSVCASIELAEALVMPALAERAYNLLLPAAAGGVRFSLAPPILVDRVLAVGARLCGRFAAAMNHVDEAIRFAREAGAEPELGLSHLERAHVLRAASPGDTAGIAAELTAAFEVFRRLDLVWAAARAREVAAEAGLSGKLTALGGAPLDELSVTEREVLQEFSTGSNSDQIASRLLLSPKTVGDHLERLATRLGVRLASDARELLHARPAQARTRATEELTAREREVLRLMAAGRTNQQIADELVISIHTAIRHVANILSKTDSANRTEAARFALD